jgi:hypothetical protein
MERLWTCGMAADTVGNSSSWMMHAFRQGCSASPIMHAIKLVCYPFPCWKKTVSLHCELARSIGSQSLPPGTPRRRCTACPRNRAKAAAAGKEYLGNVTARLVYTWADERERAMDTWQVTTPYHCLQFQSLCQLLPPISSPILLLDALVIITRK